MSPGLGTEILIVNSFTPRRRSLSDVFLDNGVALLRGHLQSRGFRAVFEDPTTIRGFDRFSSPWLSRPLRYITLAVLDPGGGEGLRSRLKGAVFLALQRALNAVQRRKARRYIDSIVERVAREGIPAVGVKVWYGDAFSWSKDLVRALNLACPETITIAGGPHANLFNHDGLILKHSGFDVAVYGEGEYALASILEELRKGKTRAERLRLVAEAAIPGVVWRDGGLVRVNPPFESRAVVKSLPDYADAMEDKARVHTIIDALGCDYNLCTFCAHKNIFGTYHKRSASAVVDEMESMLRRGVGIFRFAAGDTPLPHAMAIAKEIASRGLTVEFSMFHRAERSAPKRYGLLVADYRFLIRHGLRGIFMGIETGDDRTNCEILKKNVKGEEVVATMAAFRRARELEGKPCDLSLSMIHPVPSAGISWDELREATLKVVLESKPDSALLCPPGVFPGTEWFANARRYGFEMGPDYVETLMHYEYELYKPSEFWKEAAFSLDGRPFREILAESSRLRRAIEAAGIPTELGDEDFLILRAAEQDPQTYRRQSLVDILSCDYSYSRGLYDRVNLKSLRLASANFKAAETPPTPVKAVL